MRSVFEFKNYKLYLSEILDDLGQRTKGIRSRFAEAVECRPGYVTQVLSGSAELSPDQASLASAFLGHTDDESDHFLFLVLRARAGTPKLRQQLDKQILRHLERHRNLKARLKIEHSLTKADEIIFYSSWHYLAVLSLISIPGFQVKESIAARLNLPLKRVSEVLERLISLKLVETKAGKYVHGPGKTHLAKDSPLAAKHHLNWRLQAMQSIERDLEDGFHYSSVATISQADRERIKSLFLAAIEDAAQIIVPSPEEKLCSLCIDFFEI